MKTKIVLFLLVLVTTTNIYAEEPATCSRLTGSWYGAFWFKDPRECHINHGCRHSMLAEVTHTSGTNYQAAVHPHVGREGIYQLTCENGIVKSKEITGVIMFSCIDKTICQIKYDDDRLSANVLSAGV